MTTPRRTFLPLLVLLACAFASPAAAQAGDEVIVRYAPGTNGAERGDAREDAGVERTEALPVSGMELVDPQPGTTVAEAVAALERSPDVLYAEPDRPRVAAKLVDDTRYGDQWALPKIGAPTAWDTQTGAEGLRIAVVDSGVDLQHPDLQPNLVQGWDFVGNDAIPQDAYGHGTHVAGTIAARGNDAFGVSGVAWQASLMPLRVLDAAGYGDTSDLIHAYAVAAASGARIVNLSLGGAQKSQAEYDAMRAASDVLFVVAAGNGGGDGKGDDNDYADNDARDDAYEESFPCEYNLPNVLCVAATRKNDELAGFSNYGKKTVDIAAPGVSILSDAMGGELKWDSGTSMAAPHVAGAAALLLSEDESLTPWQVTTMLVDSAARVAALDGKVSANGRLDVSAALDATAPDPSGQPTYLSSTPQPVIVPTSAIEAVPATATPATPATTAAPVPTTRTTTPSIPAPDRLAPALGLSLTTRGALRSALAGRLKARATCSERCSLRVDLYVDARTARSLRIARGAAVVGSGRATLRQAGQASVAVRLTSAARRALRKKRSVKVTVRATASDASGNRRTRERSVTLRR